MHIEHLAIWVQDLEAMRSFYSKYFGASSGEKYYNSNKQFESYFLSFANGPRLELMKSPGTLPRENEAAQYMGLVHFAVSIGSEEKVDALTEQLKQDGFEVIDGPRRTGDGYYESVVLDPENNRIEITV
jgi:lactoylglutathione lyase